MGRVRSRSSDTTARTLVGQKWTFDRGTWVVYGDCYEYPGLIQADTCVDDTHPGPPYKIGGPLWKFSRFDDKKVKSVGEYLSNPSDSHSDKSKGGFVCIVGGRPGLPSGIDGDTSLPTNPLHSWGDLSYYGPTGWNKFKPGNPVANLGIFAYNLKQGIPFLHDQAASYASAWGALGGSPSYFGPPTAAKAWLETQFGYFPFVNDIRKLYQVTSHLSDELDKARRNNARWVEYGGSVAHKQESDTVEENTSITAHSPFMESRFYVGGASGSYVIRKKVSQRAWFRGRFRYYIPDFESVKYSPTFLAKLYGIYPCPSLLYQAVPWTWLTDWAAGVGTFLSNMETGWADNLASNGAYIMGASDYRYTVESKCTLNCGTLHDTWEFPISWKTRTGASPFGFGLTPDSFTPRQWSLLAALGISFI